MRQAGITTMRQRFNFSYFLSEGFHSIFTHGLMSFAAVCMIVACLLIMGSFSLVAVSYTHLDVYKRQGAPQVAYKETIKKTVEQDTKYARQSGGKGQYGHVKIRVEPNESGKGYELSLIHI